MKIRFTHLLLILFALSLFSCSQRILYLPSHTESLVFEFQGFSKRGFMITPEKYLGEYESIGIIDISIYPAAARQTKIPKEQDIIEGEYAQGYWLIAKINPQEVVRIIYNKANDMGADAVINFKVTSIQKQVAGELDLNGVNVSGFAIKRNP